MCYNTIKARENRAADPGRRTARTRDGNRQADTSDQQEPEAKPAQRYRGACIARDGCTKPHETAQNSAEHAGIGGRESS